LTKSSGQNGALTRQGELDYRRPDPRRRQHYALTASFFKLSRFLVISFRRR
jgi:hypothetical protein